MIGFYGKDYILFSTIDRKLALPTCDNGLIRLGFNFMTIITGGVNFPVIFCDRENSAALKS